MEGTGFRGSENSGVGSGTGESDWPPNRSHHGNGHSHHGAGSFIPGAFLGAIGGAFGHSWWTSRDRAFSPPPHSYQYGYPHQPVQHHQPHMFHMPAPPPTPTRKRACSCSCCLVVLLVIGLIIAALFVPKPGSTDLELVAGDRQLKGINTKWFREVQVAGATDVDTYMFDAEPPLNDIVHLSKDIDIKLERGSFHFVRYDVHKGSTIRAQWEFTDFTQPPSFGIIEGQQAFNEWRTGSSVRWFYDRNSAKGSYEFKAPIRAEYFLIFSTSRSWIRATGTASFQVNSVTYSIEKPVDHCPAGSPGVCVFLLEQRDSAYLLFVAPPSGDSFTMTYKTLPRNESYAALFASLSSACALFLGVAVIAWCGARCCGMICGSGRRRRYEAIAGDDQADTSPLAPTHAENSAYPNAHPTAADGALQPPFNPQFVGRSNTVVEPPSPQAPSAPPPYSVFDPNTV